jgi:hypothetical protein
MGIPGAPQLDRWKWREGQSGNPKGRPRRSEAVLDALRLNTPRAAEKIKELLNCGHAPTELRCAIYILESCPDHDRLPKDYPEALKMLKERLETGKLRLVEVDAGEESALAIPDLPQSQS